MKRLALLVTLVAAVAGSIAVANALAGTPSPLDEQTGFTCGTQDGFGNTVVTNQTSFFWYASGKATLHCVAQGAGTGSVVVWNFANTGYVCNFGFDGIPSTTDWNDRVSKSGEAQLWCYGFLAPTAPIGPSGAAGTG